MPKTKISEFSATPGNNTDIDGINIAEGCAPSGINDAIRELMSQLKDFQAGTAGDSFNGPVGTTTAAAGAFTTLSASGAVTLSGGTANGVTYLNGSKVLTTGSALTFDGTNLGVGTTSPGAKLQVEAAAGSGGGDVAIRLRDSTSTNTLQMIRTGATYSYGGMGGNEGALYSANTLTLCADSSGPIKFATNGSEQMRLTSTGLGIGTTSPAHRLHVAGNAFVPLTNSYYCYTADYGMGTPDSGGLQVFSGSGDSIRFGKRSSGTFTENVRIDGSGNVGIGTSSPNPISWGRSLTLNTTSNGAYDLAVNGSEMGYFYANASLVGVGSYANVPLAFYTNNTERARIDSSGNFLIGRSNSTDIVGTTNTGFIVKNTQLQLTATGTVAYLTTASAGSQNYVSFYSQSTATGSITTNGTTTSYVTTSDYRLKEDVQPMSGALAKVAALKPVTYKWKADGSDGEGFIAHELQDVCPDAVTGEKDAVDAEGKPVYQGIDTSFLVATLTAAIQELKAEFDAYKATHP